MVPNLKNTALIFLEIFVIEYCTVLVDCEQSLFSSKIRGERTQNKKTCKRDCERDLRAAMPRAASSVVDCEPLVAWAFHSSPNAHATSG